MVYRDYDAGLRETAGWRRGGPLEAKGADHNLVTQVWFCNLASWLLDLGPWTYDPKEVQAKHNGAERAYNEPKGGPINPVIQVPRTNEEPEVQDDSVCDSPWKDKILWSDLDAVSGEQGN